MSSTQDSESVATQLLLFSKSVGEEGNCPKATTRGRTTPSRAAFAEAKKGGSTHHGARLQLRLCLLTAKTTQSWD